MIVIEPGELATGAPVWRFRCEFCGRLGAWNENLRDVEISADKHTHALHPPRYQRERNKQP